MRRALPVLAAAAAAAGCGSGAAGGPPDVPLSSGLAWVTPPHVFPVSGRTSEFFATGTVRNGSSRRLEIRNDQVRVLAPSGEDLPTDARFIAAFGHGLYGPGGPPAPFHANRFDQERTGERATLDPGGRRPLVVAWRGRGVRVGVGAARLALPAPR